MNVKGHWSVLLAPLFPLALGLFLLARFSVTPSQTLTKLRQVAERQPPFDWTISIDIAVWLVVGYGVSMLLARAVWLLTTRVQLTRNAVEWKTGLVHQYTSRIQFKDSESVSLYQSGLGALLGCGTVTVYGRGTSRVAMANITNPRDLMMLIDKKIAEAPNGPVQATRNPFSTTPRPSTQAKTPEPSSESHAVSVQHEAIVAD